MNSMQVCWSDIDRTHSHATYAGHRTVCGLPVIEARPIYESSLTDITCPVCTQHVVHNLGGEAAEPTSTTALPESATVRPSPKPRDRPLFQACVGESWARTAPQHQAPRRDLRRSPPDHLSASSTTGTPPHQPWQRRASPGPGTEPPAQETLAGTPRRHKRGPKAGGAPQRTETAFPSTYRTASITPPPAAPTTADTSMSHTADVGALHRVSCPTRSASEQRTSCACRSPGSPTYRATAGHESRIDHRPCYRTPAAGSPATPNLRRHSAWSSRMNS